MEIERTKIKEAVDAEVSKVADLTYDNEGNSRYDGIIITSSDDPLIDGYIDDALVALQKRLIDVASVSEANTTKKITITTSNPNTDSGIDAALASSVLRYLSLNVCAAWFQMVLPERVEEYAARGQVAMDEAISLMLHRTPPTITR